MDASHLRLAMPNLSAIRAAEWAPHVTDAMGEWSVAGPKRAAAFLAQVGHESNDFGSLVESLNYSPAGLLGTFPSRVSESQAVKLGRAPGEKSVPVARQSLIGDLVYGGRMGNSKPGDGFRYRGRGAIQITGFDNYTHCGEALGLDLIHAPELLQVLPGAIRSAAWFWATHGCNELADADQFEKITHVVNGGFNGLPDRKARWESAKRALAE
jgi:putative chitinase